jgi:predicted Zn-dependent peptidase
MAERWWRLHAQPFTSTVLVVGDLRDVDLDALLGKTFEPWVTTQPALSPPALDPLGAARRGIVVDLPQGVQTTLCVGLASPPCALADRAALQVAAHVLGGYFGSRLVTRLREEKSITYGVNAQMNNRKGSSVFLLTTAVEVPATLEALTDIFDEIASVAGGVGFGDDEVRKAADNLIGRGPIAYKNAAAVADTLQSIVLNDLPDDYVDRHRADMAELTPGQVTEAFRRHVDVDRLAVAAAGPAAAITDPIRSLIPGVFVR